MEPVSTRRQVRFTPPDAEPLEGQEQPPVYLIRVPTLLERSEVEASVVGAGVRPVGGAQIRASLRAAIERCIEEPAEYLEALDRKDAEEADAQDIALLHDAEMRVADDPQYSRLVQMSMRWAPYLEWFALRHQLEGVEHAPFAIEHKNRLATEASLAEIPRDHLTAAAGRAVALLLLGNEEKKASASPSQ